ncbi:MAG: Asp-tRNA(Asn)/Glu-tRNA(Gln) amidotransferase GatCAB subunit B, partial [Clostridia bacterium]|nr:Asp-tRNA(Asn)/Glu-tRNA(Gln) amidotransferase GatCAB subunit B [Clostridia bacterium]
PDEIVREQGLEVVSDSGQLSEVVEKVISANPRSVEDYLGGKQKAIGFLMGQVMKETSGKANPQMVNQMLREKLESLK